MKKTYFILFILSFASAFGAYTPSTASSTVMVNGSGVVVSPSNFKTANYLMPSTVSTLSLTGITVTTATISTISGSVTVSGAVSSATISTGVATVSTLSATVATFSNTPTIAPTQWYAVFYIPAGEPSMTISAGVLVRTYWTDFELKGCTMTEGTTLDVIWKFFSFDNNQTAFTQIYSVHPTVWFFSSEENSRNPLLQSSSYDSIFDQLNSISTPASDSGVTGWVVVVKEPISETWFNPYNTNLYWVYRKSNSTNAENDAYGYEVWRPIFPTWTTQLPNLSTINFQ